MRNLEKFLRNTLILIAGLGSIQTTLGQVPAVSGAPADHPLFDRFAYSEIVEAAFEEDTNYRVILGSLQRTRGTVSAEDSRLMRGDLSKILYEVSQEFTGRNVYDFFRQQVIERGYTELFSCEGRACGSSNYWANDIFRNRVLYGPESNQYYLVMRAVSPGLEDNPYIAAYIITRANRRIYAYLEIIEVGGSRAPAYHLDESEMIASLRENGSVVLPGIRFADDATLAPGAGTGFLAEALIANPDIRVYVVGHLADGDSLDSLMRRSRLRAEAVRAGLLDAGVPPQQVDAEGVGPLAPYCDGFQCANRIELVLQE